MIKNSIKAGDMFEISRQAFRCQGRGPGGRFVFERMSGGQVRGLKYLSASDLQRLAADGKLRHVETLDTQSADIGLNAFLPTLDTMSIDDQQRVLSRQGYVRAIAVARTGPRRISLSDVSLMPVLREEFNRQVAEALDEGRDPPERPMSPAAARRWFRRHEESGQQIQALIGEHRGNESSRLSKEQRTLLEDIINDHYLSQRCLSAVATHKRLIHACRNKAGFDGRPVKAPSYRAVLRYISKLDRFDVIAARYGRQAAEASMRAFGRAAPAESPLERVQMDHTQLDVEVQLGSSVSIRPWLTLLYDVYTKAILGYHLTEEPPGYRSVMQCLSVAILPKDRLLAHGEEGWEYPMCGVPVTLIVDNGKEFHSTSLRRACAELGIAVLYAPPRKPWFKSQVERTFGTLNTMLLHSLGGRVFKGTKPKNAKLIPKIALEDFERILLQWVATVYHQQPLPGSDKSPLMLWKRWLSQADATPIPLDSATVRLALAQTKDSCALRTDGIHLNNAVYRSPLLALLRRHPDTEKVTVKFDPGDVSRIWVLDPHQKRYFEVPERDAAQLEGRSLFVHQLITREMRARRIAGLNDVSYLDAENALLRSIDAHATRNKRKGTVAKVARFRRGLGKERNAQADSPATSIVERLLPVSSPVVKQMPQQNIVPVDTEADDWAVEDTFVTSLDSTPRRRAADE